MAQIDPNPLNHLQGELNALRLIHIVSMKMLLAKMPDAPKFIQEWQGVVEREIDTAPFSGGSDDEANNTMRDTMALFSEEYFANFR